MENLLGFDTIDEIIKSVIWTGALEDSVPLSLLLVAEPGMGKSKALLAYKGDNIHHSSDMTSSGLLELLENDKEQRITHIVLPDLNAVLSHKTSTTNLTFGTFLSLMSEGIARIDDGRRIKEINHRPIGLLIAITTDMLVAKWKYWNATGFRRRFLPIYYEYSTATKSRIRTEISKGTVTLRQREPLIMKLPATRAKVALPADAALKIELLAVALSQKLGVFPSGHREPGTMKFYVRPAPGKPPVEFTPQLQLVALAKGRARLMGRGQVKDEDVMWLERVIDFCEYGKPVAL